MHRALSLAHVDVRAERLAALEREPIALQNFNPQRRGAKRLENLVRILIAVSINPNEADLTSMLACVHVLSYL